MAKLLKCYCPQPNCKRSTKQPFRADNVGDLVNQIWDHATRLSETNVEAGGCVHWRSLRHDEEEAFIKEFVTINAWTEDDEVPRAGFTRHAPPIGEAPRDRSRTRSPRTRATPDWEEVVAAGQEVQRAMDNFTRALAKANNSLHRG